MRPPAWNLAPNSFGNIPNIILHAPAHSPRCLTITANGLDGRHRRLSPSSEVYTTKREDVTTELPAVYAIIPLSLISRLANRVTRFEQLRIRSTTPPRVSNKMDAFSSCVASFSSRRHEWCGLSFGSLIHSVAQEACSQTSSGPQSALTYFPTALMIGG